MWIQQRQEVWRTLDYISRFPLALTSQPSFRDFPPIASYSTPTIGARKDACISQHPWWGTMGRQRGLCLSPFGSPSSIPTSAALCQPSPCSRFRALEMQHSAGNWCWHPGRRRGGGESRSPAPARGMAGRSSPKLPFASPLLHCVRQSVLCVSECPSIRIPKHTKCCLPHHYSLTNAFSTKRPPQV